MDADQHNTKDDDGATAGVARISALCELGVRTLPVDGVAVTLASGSRVAGLLATSDDLARRLDELQATLGEGPAIDAAAQHRPVLRADLADRDSAGRWPTFGPAAIGLGARAVFALPLRIGVIDLGVVSLYRREPGELDSAALARALRLTDAVAHAVLDLAQPATPAALLDFSRMLAGDYLGAEVHQASGMLMVQLGIPIEAALARLRAYAFARDLGLREVAREVVSGTLVLDN